MFDEMERFLEQARLGFAACAATAQVVGGTVATEDLGRVLADLERARRAADAAQLAVLAELARRDHPDIGPGETRLPPGETAPWCGDEAAFLLGCSPTVADRRCHLAARLATDLAALAPLLAAGTVPERTLQLVATETRDATQAGVAAVVAHLLAHKRGTDRPRLVALEHREIARAARRVLSGVDADALTRRAAANRRDQTDVHLDPGPLGTSMITAVLPTEAAIVVHAAIEELAHAAVRDRPGLRLGAARAQAFTDLTLRGVTVHPRLHLTVPVTTTPPGAGAGGVGGSAFAPTGGGKSCDGGSPAAGTGDGEWAGQARAVTAAELTQAFAPAGGGEATAPTPLPLLGAVEVPGAGWIPAETVTAIRAHGDHDLTRVLLDADTGHVTAVGDVHPGYVPRPGMRDLVRTRDGTCRMWGCTRPAAACDIDHATPWPRGATTADNLALLCRRHHRLKQSPRWTYRLRDGAVATWTSPSGATRITWPQTYLTPAAETAPEETPSPPPAGASTPSPPPAGADEPPPF